MGLSPKKVKVVFFSVSALKVYRERRITAPPILNIVTRRVECLTLNIPRGVLWSPQRTPLGILLANFC